MQLDQSEYVPGGVLLKDEFSCCIQWSYTMATTSNTQDDKTLNVSAEEFQTKRWAAVVAEQRIKIIADNKN